ncbi:MAG: Xylose isomerase domain protein barrel [Hydrocarboniphaga sp.]|uniref:sugar phosphate isomerase/epimerase family protein n=1 Tax=Hydrocarboniphaga sp. TaxID=2033016 RepID=UPI00260DF7FC|nr:TIM barrel protein [Hydrocarboniphaga sp.]MDB5970357.1 Xylose isomerase domain protein barrel [Hydrocarboniphaga sp.]
MHERISAGQTCFPDAGLAQLAGYWRELAPRRVSFVSPTLLTEPLSAVQQVLSSGGYRVETITHVFMPGQHLSPEETSWQQPRAQLTQLIEIARQIDARSIYLLTGGHGSLTWEQAAAAFCGAVAPCAAQAKAAGVSLLIEPASVLHADLHIVHSLRDTLALAEMADLGVCIDFFACWTEAGLRETMMRAIPRCDIIQVSDYVYGDRALPSRAVPGDGVIPLWRLLEWVLAAGYAGAFDLELLGPRIDHEGRVPAVARAAGELGRMLRSLGA